MAKLKKHVGRAAYDWHLVEWLRYFGKKQADLEKDLEWNKSKASLMWNGAQRYHRDDINQVATWLNLKPHELLMSPEEAMNLRSLKTTALKIAAENPPSKPPQVHDGEEKKTGTNGA